jgi:MFS transporter, DHA2 family, lincomycin resistance protein
LYSHGSAISSTLQQVAGAVGTAMLVTVMSLRTESLRASRPELTDVEALTSGLHSAFAVAAAIATLVLVLSLFVRRVTPTYEDGAPFEGAATH